MQSLARVEHNALKLPWCFQAVFSRKTSRPRRGPMFTALALDKARKMSKTGYTQ